MSIEDGNIESMENEETIETPTCTNGDVTNDKKYSEQWKREEPTSLAVGTMEYVKPGDRLLDLGCGYGRNANYFAENGINVTAINHSKEELIEAKRRAEEKGLTNIEYVHGDAGDLPLQDKSMDCVLDAGCTHMCDEETQNKAVRECARVLKEGGVLRYFGFSKEHPTYKKRIDENNVLQSYLDDLDNPSEEHRRDIYTKLGKSENEPLTEEDKERVREFVTTHKADVAQYRNLEDIEEQYSEYFDIDEESVQKNEWVDKDGDKHVGIEVTMTKKQSL